ncbi:MAG: 6,7-dimethyl-8-ribityllumazine synthase [candidate division WOR-3 bacterium]
MERRGQVSAKGKRIAIIVSRFNEAISKRLLEGATETLLQHGATEADLDVFWTPGSFELPLIAKSLAEKGGYDGILALGCIIRGETPHFDYIAAETAKGLAKVMMEYTVPLGFGIITADTMDQATDRAGGKQGNKGRLAALHLMEMMNLLEGM